MTNNITDGFPFRFRTSIALVASLCFGIIWHCIAMVLMGASLADYLGSWVVPGAAAGLAAGVHTIWSRVRAGGKESLIHGISTYYLGIMFYWLGILLSEQIAYGTSGLYWIDIDTNDHIKLLGFFLFYGTFQWSPILIPLSFLTRAAVWAIAKPRLFAC